MGRRRAPQGAAALACLLALAWTSAAAAPCPTQEEFEVLTDRLADSSLALAECRRDAATLQAELTGLQATLSLLRSSCSAHGQQVGRGGWRRSAAAATAARPPPALLHHRAVSFRPWGGKRPPICSAQVDCLPHLALRAAATPQPTRALFSVTRRSWRRRRRSWRQPRSSWRRRKSTWPTMRVTWQRMVGAGCRAPCQHPCGATAVLRGGGGGGICVEHPMNCLHARVSAGSPPELRRPWCSPYLAGAL